MKSIGILVTVGALAATLTGERPGEREGGTGRRQDRRGEGDVGGTLRAARAADVVLWDPAHINENDSLWAGFQTNGNLIMATPDGKGFQPYIAKTWKISEGRQDVHVQPRPQRQVLRRIADHGAGRGVLVPARQRSEGDRQLAVPEGLQGAAPSASRRWSSSFPRRTPASSRTSRCGARRSSPRSTPRRSATRASPARHSAAVRSA